MWVAYLKIDIVELSVKGLKSNGVGLRWKDGRTGPICILLP